MPAPRPASKGPAFQEPAPPRLPHDLPRTELSELDSTSWYQSEVQSSNLSSQGASGVEFEQCVLERVTLHGSSLTRASLIDCAVQLSDWANLSADSCVMRRVTFNASRLTGMSYLDGGVRDAVFTDCRMDLSNWRATKFITVQFRDCDLTRADFAGADLSGALFTGCRLMAAQFSGAKLAGARFSGCDLTGLGGVESLAGASVRADDLMALTELLAGALGITVES